MLSNSVPSLEFSAHQSTNGGGGGRNDTLNTIISQRTSPKLLVPWPIYGPSLLQPGPPCQRRGRFSMMYVHSLNQRLRPIGITNLHRYRPPYFPFPNRSSPPAPSSLSTIPFPSPTTSQPLNLPTQHRSLGPRWKNPPPDIIPRRPVAETGMIPPRRRAIDCYPCEVVPPPFHPVSLHREAQPTPPLAKSSTSPLQPPPPHLLSHTASAMPISATFTRLLPFPGTQPSASQQSGDCRTTHPLSDPG